MKSVRYTYESVEAIEGPLKCGEAELYKDVGNENDDVESQPPHVHHKVLKKDFFSHYICIKLNMTNGIAGKFF